MSGQGHSQGQNQYHQCGALKKLCMHGNLKKYIFTTIQNTKFHGSHRMT